jgi:Reverse transcriptase (RNA-dependent DNA polymerase)
MSGRTQGRGDRNARGGRGRGRPNTPRKPQAKPQGSVTKKFQGNSEKLQGCIFDCSDNKQADTFVTTIKRISEYIGSEYKHGGDIRSSIVNETKFTIPIPAAPTIVDPAALTPLEVVANMIFKGKIDAYIKRDAVLEDNIQKAYSLVLGQCTDLLQSKLKQQSTWAAIALAQDVIDLVKLIKTITFKFEDQKYLPLALYQAKMNLYNLRQHNLSNHEYLLRFNNLVDVATTYNGSLHDSAIVSIVSERLHPGIDPTNLTAVQAQAVELGAHDLYLATMFISQSDRRRYGKLSEDLENSFTKGNDDYPSDVVSAFHLINEYKNWQPRSAVPEASGVAFAQKNSKKNNKNDKTEDWKKEATCHKCGKKGHIRPDCPEDDDDDEKETPSPKKSILKKKTGDKKKPAVNFATDVASDAEDEETESQFYQYGFCTTSSNRMNLRNMILLDNQSTVDLFCNKNLVSEVWDSDDSMTVKGNGGLLHTNKKAFLRNYGEIWFHPKAITNILSLKNVRERFQVTFDSDTTNTFMVHKPNGPPLKFHMHKDGLYYHDPKEHQMALVNTVKDAEEGFSKRQIAQAKIAREFQAVVGNPSTHDLKAIVSSNQIANCPINVDDIDRAETIYGPSVPILKGKTTRRSPDRVVSDYITIPKKVIDSNKNVDLSGDIFFINKIPFFATVSDNIKFTTTEHLANRKIKNILIATEHVKNIYHGRGFEVKTLLMDGEFSPLRHSLADLSITLNVTSANEHVPQIERQIRVIKERVRATRHSLPFRFIPALMLVELVYFSTMWINAFPPKGGVSSHISPRGILTGTQFDYKKHCKLPFGSYVQAHEEPSPTNTQAARTVGAISLGPTGNLQGSYKFLNLRTGRLITRRTWTSLPMPDEVIARVNALGKSENQPELLTFYDRRGLTLGELDLPHKIETETPEFDEYDEEADGLEPPTLNNEYGLDEESPDNPSSPEPHGIDPQEFFAPNSAHHSPLSDAHDTPETPASDPIRPSENLPPPQNHASDFQSPPLPPVADEIAGARRPQRVRSQPQRIIPSFSGKSYKSTAATQIQGVHRENVIHPDHHLNHQYSMVTFYIMTQLSMKAGLKRWKDKGESAISEELSQLHFRDTFDPLNPKELSKEEYNKVLESHLFLKQKRDDSIKGRMVAGGDKQRSIIPAQEASSPTASLEAVLLTATIDALEGRDVGIVDIPNAFVTTRITNDEDKAIMRLRGKLAELLVKVAPKIYTKYVIINKKGETVLYVKLLNALYGIMKAALLYYQKFVENLESIGFVLNPYDPCVANKMVHGKQLTVVWHVDDLKISHASEQVVTRMINWLERTYVRLFDDGSGAMKSSRGKVHDYLGMRLNYTEKGQVTISMEPYILEIVELFKKYDPSDKIASTPAAEHIFKVDETTKKIPAQMGTIFHHFVAKCLFATKRARPDIAVAVAFLTTRVKSPDEDDWKKLVRMIRYLRGTLNLSLRLSATSAIIPKWWVDGAHGVHPNMRGHTGACLSLGKGMPVATSTKQKINTRSSTETEVVAVDDLMPIILWTNYFLEAQGYGTTSSILYQDNKSAILLENNGRKSSSKRTKHIHMRYYFITDRIWNNELSVEHCPTESMVADFFTKPLQGKLFYKFRSMIMNTNV